MKEFNVDFNQIGHAEDFEDWFYTHVIQKILSDGGTPHKNAGSGTTQIPKDDIIQSLLNIIPNGKIIATSNFPYRSKICYAIVDAVKHHTYVTLTYYKKDKTESVDFAFVTSSKEVLEKFEDYAKTNFSNNRKNSIYVIAQASGGGLTLHNLGAIDHPLERGNYSEDVVKSYDYVVEQFNKSNPYGRLAIFNGPAGTGKTFLLRSLIGSIKDSLVVLLPSKLVGEIDSPALITLLAEEKAGYGYNIDIENENQSLPILFIIEDADACLVPRESDNILTISSLLNYTDGILGSMLDLRVIATTNQESIDFDEALTRPGRLCRHVYVGNLPPEKASEIYKRMSGKDKEYKKPTSLAQVYADVNGGFEDINNPKNVLGFGT